MAGTPIDRIVTSDPEPTVNPFLAYCRQPISWSAEWRIYISNPTNGVIFTAVVNYPTSSVKRDKTIGLN